MKRAVDRSGIKMLSILLVQSETFSFFGVQLNGDLSRAPVDWERARRFLMLFSSLCALARALPPVVGAWFPVPSLAFPALASSARTVPVLVASWFQIQHRISSSIPRAFALLKMFPKHYPSLGLLLLLHFELFKQLGCPLCSRYCSHCRSQLKLCCFALHLLLVTCFCLYMQANDSPNLLCTFLLFLGVLQRN